MPTLGFILPEIARKAKFRKDGEVDLFSLEDLQGPEHFVLVGFNVGDHGVQVGNADGKMAIVCRESPLDDNETILRARGYRILNHYFNPLSTEIMCVWAI